MSARTWLLVLLSCGTVGCNTPRLISTYPPRAADLYPLSQTQAGISVAVDEVGSGERASLYFGADLPAHRILPVALIVTNNGRHRVILQPRDILLHQGSQVLDPLPPDAVATLLAPPRLPLVTPGPGLSSHLDTAAFKETMLAPGESYHGVLFFVIPPGLAGQEYPEVPVFSTGGLELVLAARDMDSRARLHFGPFSLAQLWRDNP